jgi:hypothetical protein
MLVEERIKYEPSPPPTLFVYFKFADYENSDTAVGIIWMECKFLADEYIFHTFSF